jgi:hypothetical protein
MGVSGNRRIGVGVSKQFVHLQRDFAECRDRTINAGKHVEDYCGMDLMPNELAKTTLSTNSRMSRIGNMHLRTLRPIRTPGAE